MSNLMKLLPKIFNVGIRIIPQATITIKSNINYHLREFSRLRKGSTKKSDFKKIEDIKVNKLEEAEYVIGDEVFHTENDSIAGGILINYFI
jgi:hypothetical protein